MTFRSELKKLNNRRECVVCGQTIAPRAGVYYAGVGDFLAHQGECSRRVEVARRAYDRSRRGRDRPWRDVLRRLRPDLFSPKEVVP